MKIIIKVGDVLSEPADVLISTANPSLNLSGGVNGAIREAVGPDLQTELHELLKQQGPNLNVWQFAASLMLEVQRFVFIAILWAVDL